MLGGVWFVPNTLQWMIQALEFQFLSCQLFEVNVNNTDKYTQTPSGKQEHKTCTLKYSLNTYILAFHDVIKI